MPPGVPGGPSSVGFFADDKCTVPYTVLESPIAGCTPPAPKYIGNSYSGMCGAGSYSTAYRVQGPVLSSPGVYTSSNGSCVSAAEPPRPGTAMRIEGPVDDTTFVAGTRGLEDLNAPSGNRLTARVIRGADGSKTYERSGFYDPELDVDCAFRKAADGELRCLPAGPKTQFGTVYFADDGCTQEIVLGNDGGFCGPSPAFILAKAVGCVDDSVQPTRVFRVGTARQAPTVVHELDGESCRVATPYSSLSAFDATEVQPTSLVRGTPLLEP